MPLFDIVDWADANGASYAEGYEHTDISIISIYQELVIQKIPRNQL